jgi:hypothetical protein
MKNMSHLTFILRLQFDEALEGRINFKEFAALLEHIRAAEKKVRERRLLGKGRSKKDKTKVWKVVSRETGFFLCSSLKLD